MQPKLPSGRGILGFPGGVRLPAAAPAVTSILSGGLST